MRRKIETLSDFVEQKSSRRLWVFGWMAFTASLVFAANFYWSVPMRMAKLESTRTALRTKLLDLEHVSRVTPGIVQALSLHTEVAKFYSSNLTVLLTNAKARRKVAVVGNNRAVSAIAATEKIIGELDGIRFSESELSSYVAGIRADLEMASKPLRLAQSVFQLCAGPGQVPVQAFSDALSIPGLVSHRDVAAAESRMLAWKAKMMAVTDERMSDVNALAMELRGLVLHFIATFPAMAYALGFVLYALVRWRIGSRTPQPRRAMLSRR